MRPDVARDLSDSAYDFQRVVWPVAKHWLRGGDLRPVESVAPAEFEKQLDTLSGIDAWQIVAGEGIRGLSSRVQWPRPDEKTGTPQYWPTFTIRLSRSNGTMTELEKRRLGFKNRQRGYIQPAFLIHAYVCPPRRHGELTYACMCRAEDLFALAGDEMVGRTWYPKTNPSDGNKFAVFPVDRLLEHNVFVSTWITPLLEAA